MAARWWAPVRAALADAVVTFVAILLTLATTILIAPEIGPAVLGVMLALTLSRSQLERDLRGRIEAAIALPFIGLIATGVGFLLLDLRVVGAVVYVVGLSGAIFIRRFGDVPRRIGSLLALPFIAVLVAPVPIPAHPVGPLAGVAWLVPPIVALVAFAWVTLCQLGARAIRLLPPRRRAWARPAPAPRPAPAGDAPQVTLLPTDKLALQFGLSLALAFAVGFVFFGDRWAWIVLTVVVVAIGNTGRADVLYKGVQRIAGAAVGTALALLPAIHLGSVSPASVALLLGVLFLGLFGRNFAYIWWALFFTLALALLQAFSGGGADGNGGGFLLGERLEEILIGSALSLLVAWFVLPLRSENTVRRRLATVLAALQERMAVQDDDTAHQLDGALRDLETVSKPYDAWRRFFRRATRPRAGLWIATARDCVELGRDGADPDARSLLGAARRSIREPDELQPALERLRDRLIAG